jgi:hypothetical protein
VSGLHDRALAGAVVEEHLAALVGSQLARDRLCRHPEDRALRLEHRRAGGCGRDPQRDTSDRGDGERGSAARRHGRRA